MTEDLAKELQSNNSDSSQFRSDGGEDISSEETEEKQESANEQRSEEHIRDNISQRQGFGDELSEAGEQLGSALKSTEDKEVEAVEEVIEALGAAGSEYSEEQTNLNERAQGMLDLASNAKQSFEDEYGEKETDLQVDWNSVTSSVEHVEGTLTEELRGRAIAAGFHDERAGDSKMAFDGERRRTGTDNAGALSSNNEHERSREKFFDLIEGNEDIDGTLSKIKSKVDDVIEEVDLDSNQEVLQERSEDYKAFKKGADEAIGDVEEAEDYEAESRFSDGLTDSIKSFVSDGISELKDSAEEGDLEQLDLDDIEDLEEEIDRDLTAITGELDNPEGYEGDVGPVEATRMAQGVLSDAVKLQQERVNRGVGALDQIKGHVEDLADTYQGIREDVSLDSVETLDTDVKEAFQNLGYDTVLEVAEESVDSLADLASEVGDVSRSDIEDAENTVNGYLGTVIQEYGLAGDIDTLTYQDMANEAVDKIRAAAMVADDLQEYAEEIDQKISEELDQDLEEYGTIEIDGETRDAEEYIDNQREEIYNSELGFEAIPEPGDLKPEA